MQHIQKYLRTEFSILKRPYIKIPAEFAGIFFKIPDYL